MSASSYNSEIDVLPEEGLWQGSEGDLSLCPPFFVLGASCVVAESSKE